MRKIKAKLVSKTRVPRPRSKPRGAASILCEKCGSPTRCRLTTRRKGVVYRQRQCRNCGHRFYSYEAIYKSQEAIENEA